MKISDEEVSEAARVYSTLANGLVRHDYMKRAIKAALRVRKRIKRERETAKELA